MKPSSTDKKCFLLEDGTCQEKYENCAEYDSDQDFCNDDKVPFVQLDEGISLYDLDHRKECFYNTTSKKCLPRIKKCHDLKSTEGEDVCITLEATDSTKKNVFMIQVILLDAKSNTGHASFTMTMKR